jgi:hypothetical protein
LAIKPKLLTIGSKLTLVEKKLSCLLGTERMMCAYGPNKQHKRQTGGAQNACTKISTQT